LLIPDLILVEPNGGGLDRVSKC